MKRIVHACVYPSYDKQDGRRLVGALLKVTYDDATRDYWKLTRAAAAEAVRLLLEIARDGQ